MRRAILAAGTLLLFVSPAARADILLYPLPKTRLAFVMEGHVTVNPGGTVSFQHARFSEPKVHFLLKEVTFHRVPTARSIAQQKLQKAVKAQDAEGCLQAGRWALHHGLLSEFYEAAAAAWKLNPNHPTVKRLASLKRKMDAPLPASTEQEQEVRKYVTAGKPMTFSRSKHFLLYHDTALAGAGGGKTSRAAERLDLLETVYASFLIKFWLEGYELDVPRQQLKVVLFAERSDFLNFNESLKPELSKAAGFYDRKADIAVFFDQSTNEEYLLLDRLNRDLQARKERAVKDRSPDAPDLRRLADVLQLLTQVEKENDDIEVVSHETTHHLAAATGLMPNHAPVPVWAAEGLATYFEAPKEAAWSGIGAVNQQRLNWYRELAPDREHSNVEFIVSDRIFQNAAADEAVGHAYGQSWALTHFLMERHFDKLVRYYLALGEMRSDYQLSPDAHLDTFKSVFGEDTAALDEEWRKYMRWLRTDLEIVLKGL